MAKKSVVSGDDKKNLEAKFRRMTKMKLPKKPKLDKKPSANASLEVIERWIEKNQAKMQRYQAEVDAFNKVKKEKTQAKEKLNKVYLDLRY
jgi:hypothetical protein